MKKNKHINELNTNIIKLESKTECLEKMAELYEEKFAELMGQIAEDNKVMKEELSKLRDVINQKCNTPPAIIIKKEPTPPVIIKEEPRRRCIIF